MMQRPSTSCSAMSHTFNADYTAPIALFILHLTLALYYRFGLNVNITADPLRSAWDWWWQTLSIDLLRSNPIEALWHLHAQPPLHNAFGALFIHLFGDSHLEAIHIAHMFLGGLIAALSFSATRLISGSRPLALLVGLAVALNPALFLFEANLLYDVPTIALLMLAVWFVARFKDRRCLADLYGMVGALTALTLLRSLYHPFLLIPSVLFSAVLAGERWRRAVFITALIAALPFAWATKNAIQFDFWGMSSWSGMNLWKIVVTGYTPEELVGLADAGVIARMPAEVERFSLPEAYAPYGFDRRSDIAALAQNDFNNANIPAVSLVYQEAALTLIRRDPARYFQQVFIAYSIFTCPATNFEFVRQNAERIAAHNALYANAFYLAPLTQRLSPLFCSAQFFLIPVLLFAFWLHAVIRYRASLSCWRDAVRADAGMFVSAGLITYTVLVGSLLEIPENARFKLMIEPLLWMFSAVSVGRLVERAQARRRQRRSAVVC
ncbi:MAG: glycosyltransferase family 39 protein [Aggregatilineales bacterium]